jgi:hypothetical protein
MFVQCSQALVKAVQYNEGDTNKTKSHRGITYYIEIKAIYCHTNFGQFLGSHQTLKGGGRYFCRFYLAVFNAVSIARATINKYRIIT